MPGGRPVLRNPYCDQGLVQPLAGDAGVVTHVEVTVHVLEGDRDRLFGVRPQVDELLVRGVRWGSHDRDATGPTRVELIVKSCCQVAPRSFESSPSVSMTSFPAN